MSSFKIATLSSNNINVILPNFTTRYGISATEKMCIFPLVRPPKRLNALGVVYKMGPFQRPLWYHTKHVHGLDFQPIHWVFATLGRHLRPISIPIFFLWKNRPLFFVAGYDGADIRVRFWNWWHRGYNNAFRRDRWFPAHPCSPSECLPCIKLWWLVNIFLFGWIDLSTYHYPSLILMCSSSNHPQPVLSMS